MTAMVRLRIFWMMWKEIFDCLMLMGFILIQNQPITPLICLLIILTKNSGYVITKKN